jgi:TatD DNase family protein
MLVDTHAHLTFPQLADDRAATICRAQEAGVSRIVDVGTNLRLSRQAVTLSAAEPDVYATVGIHPHDVEMAGPEDLGALAGLIAEGGPVGVGETGLDFFRDYAPHDLQERIFRWHLRQAVAHELPLVVHSRGAEDRVLDIVAEEIPDGAAGVLHCFGGDLAQALRGISLGFHIGIGGTVTFKNSGSLDIALGVPRDRLLLETDCPYLAPVPHRGKRNEPAFVRDTAEFLASRADEALSTLAAQTTQNACRLFKLGEGREVGGHVR